MEPPTENTNTGPFPVAGLVNSAWLSAIVTNLPQGVVLEDNNHSIQITNQQLCDLFHVKVKAADLTGKRTSVLFRELHEVFEDPIAYSKRTRTLVRLGQPSHKEVVKLKDGRMLLRDYIPIKENDRITGHLWMYSEETERIRSEALLQEQQKFYEDILNSLPSDIAVFSPDHRYLYVNPVGVKDPEMRKWLVGKTDFDYCIYRGKDIALAERRHAVFSDIIASGKEKEWEEKFINKNGEVEYHLRKMSPLYDEHGQLVWVIGYSVNITERKKIEEKIQLSERRYRDLFNYSQAIICTHDLKGRLLSGNSAFSEILGYDESELVGKDIRDFLPEEDRPAYDDFYLKSISSGNNKIKGLFKIRHKTGRKVYLLYQNYRVEESSEGDAYIIAFAQDVTDRINVEKELKVAKRLTEETARNKERFLANMSHEIRTPMNGIIGITSFLQKTRLDEQQRSYLNIIQESAHDLLSIINDILDLEKLGTGNVQLEKIPFDIVAKTRSTMKLFELPAADHGTKIEFTNHLGEECWVNGDPTRFNQIMNNLLSNAVKFTSNGQITIEAHFTEETLGVPSLDFSIRDSGIGMDPANVQQIFQPFTQAYPETTRKYGGTGLGLAITKNLVELQRGKIWVETAPGKGSAFHFSIPCEYSNETEKQKGKDTQYNNRLGKLQVLLAEDNEVNQMLTKAILAQIGFETKVAATGREALDLMAANEFDVVLMDIQMPELNGLEATQMIRQMPGHKGTIPVIALTANALAGEETKYLSAGMNGYLTKPFSEAALYHVIESALNRNNDQKTQTDTPDMQAHNNETLYDLTLVNELARGNQEFIVNLSKIFVDTVPVTAAEMVQACAQEDWEQVGKLAHKLKSTIDTLGIHSLKDDIRLLEKNGKNKQDLESIPPMVAKTDSVISQVTAQLRSAFNL